MPQHTGSAQFGRMPGTPWSDGPRPRNLSWAGLAWLVAMGSAGASGGAQLLEQLARIVQAHQGLAYQRGVSRTRGDLGDVGAVPQAAQLHAHSLCRQGAQHA